MTSSTRSARLPAAGPTAFCVRESPRSSGHSTGAEVSGKRPDASRTLRDDGGEAHRGGYESARDAGDSREPEDGFEPTTTAYKALDRRGARPAESQWSCGI